jgi:WD40 repeat protein
MFGLKPTGQQNWERNWQHQLTEYVTRVAWSPDGSTLAACSAAGELILQAFGDMLATPQYLAVEGEPIEQLAFSADSQFLATGGQSGKLQIWQRQGDQFIPFSIHHYSGCWIEQLCWHPTELLLAFNVGHMVEVLQLPTQQIVAKLDFENSSVLCLKWHPHSGQLLAGGYQSIKVWNSCNWLSQPILISIDSAALIADWSPDGFYLAAGNFDRTITILEWGGSNPHPDPWIISGFQGKVYDLAWSSLLPTGAKYRLASVSAEGIVIWEKHLFVGWQGQPLDLKGQSIKSIAFQPQRRQLAAAGADGVVNIWHNTETLAHLLTGASAGFSSLSWHPWAQSLAAGGSQGEIFVWSQI